MRSPDINNPGPTCAEMLRAIADDERLSVSAKRRHTRDIKWGCRRLGKEPSEVPANARFIANFLAGLSPGGLGVSQKRISNVKSAFRKGLATLFGVGIIGKKRNRSAEWQALHDQIHDRFLRARMSRFMGYASARMIGPSDVCDEISFGYRTWLQEHVVVLHPELKHNAFVNDWNRLTKELAAWPKASLTVPPNPRIYRLKWKQFQSEFVAAIESYLDRSASDDPFDLTSQATSLKPGVVITYRDRLRRYASAIVLSGGDVNALRSLDDLTDVNIATRALRHMRDRDRSNGFTQVAQLATLITKIAKDQLASRLNSLTPDEREAADANIAQLNKLKSNLAQKPGLSQKTRQRLTPLRDEAVLARLLLLPIALAKSLERRSDPTRDDAVLAQIVLLLFILIYCPLRITSLLSVRLDRHVRWSRPEMKGELTLEFEDGELKNGEPASMPLPADCARFLRIYVKRFLPLLNAETPFLFVGKFSDRPKTRVAMGVQVRALIFNRTGLTVNAHLFRHIVHLIVLRKFPGAYAMVARILTHKNIETSLRNYAYFDVELSMRAYQQMVREASRGQVSQGTSPLGRAAYDDRSEG